MQIWLKFDHPDDEEASHAANIFPDGEGGTSVPSFPRVPVMSAHQSQNVTTATLDRC